jgi:hypothetical protein
MPLGTMGPTPGEWSKAPGTPAVLTSKNCGALRTSLKKIFENKISAAETGGLDDCFLGRSCRSRLYPGKVGP